MAWGTVTVAPVTSTLRGGPTEVRLTVDDGMKFPCTVNLVMLQTVPQASVGPRLGQLRMDRMEEVRRAMLYSTGFDPIQGPGNVAQACDFTKQT